MTIKLGQLAEECVRRRPVILLGAGASVPSGGPVGLRLSQDLARDSLGFEGDWNRPLDITAQMVELRRSRRDLVIGLQRLLGKFKPQGGMAALPHGPFRNIYTTNFDRLIEESFAAANRGLPVVRSEYDYAVLDEHSSSDGPILFKIHGCLSQDRGLGHKASMVVSRKDYQKPTEYRQGIFDRLSSEIQASGLLIVGYSLSDPHLEKIVQEALSRQRQSGVTGRVYLLLYEQDDDLASIYEMDGLRVAFGGIDELMEAISTSFAVGTEEETALLGSTQDLLAARFPRLLTRTIDVVKAAQLRSDPGSMFSGRAAGYSEILNGFTFERDVEAILLESLSGSCSSMAIVGPAGVGKTTAARRTIIQAMGRGAACWEHNSVMPLSADDWLGVHSHLQGNGKDGILFVDDGTRHQRSMNHLVDGLANSRRESGFGLRVLTTAEWNQWSPRQKARAFFRPHAPQEMRRLSDGEIYRLLVLLENQVAVANLAPTDFIDRDREERFQYIREHCGSDMFVALKILFQRDSLDDVVLREFDEMQEPGKSVYRLVAGLEAAGAIVHRQMALRLLEGQVRADELSFVLGNQLLGTVTEYEDTRFVSEEGIFVWETRHEVIARILAGFKYADQEDIVSLFEDVIGGINPSVRVEREFISAICHKDYGIKRIADSGARRRLLLMLRDKDPTNRVPWHRLIRSYIDSGDLLAAETCIANAIESAKSDPPIQRYKVQLLLERASYQRGLPEEDRMTLLRRARESAEWGMERYDDNKYMFFIFEDVARAWYHLTGEIEWMQDALDDLAGSLDTVNQSPTRGS